MAAAQSHNNKDHYSCALVSKIMKCKYQPKLVLKQEKSQYKHMELCSPIPWLNLISLNNRVSCAHANVDTERQRALVHCSPHTKER